MIFSQSHSEQFVVINPVITIQKITNAPKNLMCGKSTSMELISSEMLKKGTTSIYIFLKPLQKLLNFIWNSEHFLAVWNERIFVPLHKSGINKLDLSDCRSISVSLNFGKLFNTAIHSRLLHYIKKSSLINENQIGFKEKSRTSDHVFAVKTIFEHLETKNTTMKCLNSLHESSQSIWHYIMESKTYLQTSTI